MNQTIAPPHQPIQTETYEFMGELDAGIFAEKIARGVMDTALAVMQHERPGEVILKFNFSKASIQQVNVGHKITTKAPTKNGFKQETNSTSSVLYVTEKGKMSIFPENQSDMFANKKGK